jgi:hypothetical protein
MFFIFAITTVALIFATAMLGIIYAIVKAALAHHLKLEKIRHGYPIDEAQDERGGAEYAESSGALGERLQ